MNEKGRCEYCKPFTTASKDGKRCDNVKCGKNEVVNRYAECKPCPDGMTKVTDHYCDVRRGPRSLQALVGEAIEQSRPEKLDVFMG